mmetsp:Transcript_27740/g.79957  ORF Transcript_27740/g.79957 Transcript_27740/m.79957 type:complete len:221 (-) Transcript_27740:414-1076(-)
MARACEVSTSCSTQLSSTSVSPYWMQRRFRAATLPSAARPRLARRRLPILPNGREGGIAADSAISFAFSVTSNALYSSIMTTASQTPKKSPEPPTTSTVETPRSSSSGRTFDTKGVMGSLSAATRRFILSSRIMKFVAHVSSSTSSVVAPASSASTMFAACEVEPEASPVEKRSVSLPKGRLLMKGEMSVHFTERPSSARIFTASGSQTTYSRPSPGTLL